MYKKEGVDISKHVRKNSLLHAFCNIFMCQMLLSYFAVFGADFHYKTFAMINFLSLKSFTVFFFMDLLIGCLKKFLLEMGGQIGRRMYEIRGSYHAYIGVR